MEEEILETEISEISELTNENETNQEKVRNRWDDLLITMDQILTITQSQAEALTNYQISILTELEALRNLIKPPQVEVTEIPILEVMNQNEGDALQNQETKTEQKIEPQNQESKEQARPKLTLV